MPAKHRSTSCGDVWCRPPAAVFRSRPRLVRVPIRLEVRGGVGAGGGGGGGGGRGRGRGRGYDRTGRLALRNARPEGTRAASTPPTTGPAATCHGRPRRRGKGNEPYDITSKLPTRANAIV